jgi:rubredoxin
MRRELVWVETPNFQGWTCSHCSWVFRTSDAPAGDTIEEMKQNFERHRDQDFASHSCQEQPKSKNPKLS